MKLISKCDSVGRIAQSVEHRNGSPRFPGSSPGTAAYFSYPVTFGDQCGSGPRPGA